MRINAKLFPIIFTLTTLLFSCKSVTINKTDKTPPLLSMGAFTQGLKKKVLVKSNEMPKEILIAENKKAFWIANSSDKAGLKSLQIEVVSGGFLRFDNILKQKVMKQNDTTLEGKSKTGILISGILEFNSPTSKIILKSKATDWAGNTTFTPTVSVKRIPKPIARLSANRTRIQKGKSVILNYETEHATKVFLNNLQLPTLNGQKTFTLLNSTNYILKAVNEIGEVNDTVRIRVTQPPTAPSINSFTVSSRNIKKGERVTLRWNVANSNRIKLFKNGTLIDNSTNSSGSKNITLNNLGTINFKLEASNNTSTIFRELDVRVTPDTRCFTFPYAGNFTASSSDATATIFNYRSSNLYVGQRISSIKNPLGTDVRLWLGGRTQIIEAGRTTNYFNGLAVDNLWELIVLKPLPNFIKLEVCTQRN